MTFWPTTKTLNKGWYYCSFCGDPFEQQQSLGGHIRSKHPRMSESYKQRQIVFAARTHDREIHVVAKDIYKEIQEGTLGELDCKTFKQSKKQNSKVEKAFQISRRNKERIELTATVHHSSIELEPELKVTKEQINNSNKSKIRCIKQKIYK